MITVAFFNNKGGVGKTSLVYHLACMYAKLDYNVVAADLDPQANLTSMFLNDEELEGLWESSDGTIHAALRPLLDGTGDVAAPALHTPRPGLGLVAGDIMLSGAEDDLSSLWLDCLDGKLRAYRVLSAIWRALSLAASHAEADLVLLDVGPNLGGLNRAALVAADRVIVPLAPDLYSLQGLRTLGPTLRRWRHEWRDRRERCHGGSLALPSGSMWPIGYLVTPHIVRLDRPRRAHERWLARIPSAYRHHVLAEGEPRTNGATATNDEHCLATLKHFRILMPLAREARKPMFELKPADGATAGHTRAVADCHRDFKALAEAIAARCGVTPSAA